MDYVTAVAGAVDTWRSDCFALRTALSRGCYPPDIAPYRKSRLKWFVADIRRQLRTLIDSKPRAFTGLGNDLWAG